MNRKSLWIMVFTVSIAALLSLAVSKSQLFQQIAESQRLINNVYKNIITNYADDIDIEAFTRESIRDILENLDPYTVYLEDEEKDGLDILTHGKYGGVGMHLGRREGKLTVIAPMDDSPAQRAGIIRGDVIVKIDGRPTIDMSINDAAKEIRGKKGTKVSLTIHRMGSEDDLEFSLVRGDIRVDDVTYSGMIDDKNGYIRLTRFSKNSISEMKSAVSDLVKHNPESIILDLRDNPGGLLNAAIDILDMFVPEGEMLLSTKGRNRASNRVLKAKREPIISDDIKIAVLINEGSASASEIVSGTLQDLDRAIIVGRPSFGKGLVQSVFDLDRSRSLKITTAKYYIPSGRLIQKPGYVDEKIVLNSDDDDSLFTTLSGRTVKGGGGIAPDFEVDVDKLGPLMQECYRKSVFFTYAQKHQSEYDTLDDVIRDVELIEKFQTFLSGMDLDIRLLGEKRYNEMKDLFLENDSSNTNLSSIFDQMDQYIDEKETSLFEKEKDQIKEALHMEFAQSLENSRKKIEISLKYDNVLSETIRLLNDDVAYTEILSSNLQ